MTTSGEHRSPVTVIGLGLMGAALAGAFLDAGHPTTVWNRSVGKADAVVARGAVRAASVVEAVSATPLVVVCVRDYAAVRQLLAPVGDVLADRVGVNLTSGSSEESRAMVTWAAERGARYLDGTIMMTPPAIGKPDTVILYGGRWTSSKRTSPRCGCWAAPPTSAPTPVSRRCTTWRCWASCGGR